MKRGFVAHSPGPRCRYAAIDENEHHPTLSGMLSYGDSSATTAVLMRLVRVETGLTNFSSAGTANRNEDSFCWQKLIAALRSGGSMPPDDLDETRTYRQYRE